MRIEPSPAAPFLISWNVTRRCNLRCIQCYLDAKDEPDATATEEALSFIKDISEFAPAAMLVFSGGEPLLREDLFLLCRKAMDAGLTAVIGTNATLLTDTAAEKLKKSGVKGVGISIDSVNPALHDTLRGASGAWNNARRGIEATKKAGIPFQIQFAVTKANCGELERVVEFSEKIGAVSVNIFFPVSAGRGERAMDITARDYEEALGRIVELARAYDGRITVRPRCAPTVLRMAPELVTSGCIAGRGYLRIDPAGYVSACPYMPVEKMNLKDMRLREICESPLFKTLRNPSLKGRCGECEYRETCGGCRARALSEKGDIAGEDPFCLYEPERPAKGGVAPSPLWTEEAKTLLGAVPVFLRTVVEKAAERYASKKGLKTITVDVLKELKKTARGGAGEPH
jgi:radical SAM protein with 4Fe4S-binding SPASM domain